jgi:hypothetical protein
VLMQWSIWWALWVSLVARILFALLILSPRTHGRSHVYHSFIFMNNELVSPWENYLPWNISSHEWFV